MSWNEVGKSAKRMGHEHPRVMRRTDPEPARPTPKAKPQRKQSKPYGYISEMKWPRQEWKPYNHWFRTAQQRDQAMRDATRKCAGSDWLRIVGPVDRCSASTPGEK